METVFRVGDRVKDSSLQTTRGVVVACRKEPPSLISPLKYSSLGPFWKITVEIDGLPSGWNRVELDSYYLEPEEGWDLTQ